MADELKITANFDAAPIIEGAEKVVEAIKSIGDAVNASVTPTEASFKASAAGVDALLTSLGATAEVVKEVGAEFSSLPASLAIAQSVSKMAVSMQEASVGAGILVENLTGLNAAEQVAGANTGILDVGLANLATVSEQLLTSLGATSESLTAVGNYGATASEQINTAGVQFNITSEAAASLGASLDVMLSQLGASGGEVNLAAEQFTLFSHAEEQVAASATKMDAVLAQLGSLVAETGAAFDQLVGSSSNASSSVAQSAEQLKLYGLGLQGMDAALLEMAQLQTAAAGSASELATSQSAVTGAMQQGVQAASAYDLMMTAALSQMANAQIAFAAEKDGIDSVLQEMSKAQVAFKEAADGAAQLAIHLGEGVIVSRQMAEAIKFLNNAEAQLASKSGDVAAAQEIIRQGAQKLNLELRQTAEGMMLMKGATGAADAANERFLSGIAISAGSLGGYAAQVGNLGLTLGFLSRSIPLLQQALVVAFAPLVVAALAAAFITLRTKIEEVIEGVRKASIEFDNLAGSMVASADATQMQNLKLEDQIAKLEGRPTTNHLKEALLEINIQANELTKTLLDATEKALELLRTGEIGAFKSFITGSAETTDISGKMKERLTALEDAVSRQKAADVALQAEANEANIAAKVMAEKDVERERKKTLDEAVELQKQVQQRKQHTKDLAAQGGAVYTGPGGSSRTRDRSTEDIDKEFAIPERQVRDIITLLQEEKVKIDAVHDAQKKLTEVEQQQQDAELRSQKKTLTEPGIKSDEAAGKQRAELKRKQAEQDFRDEESAIKNQIEKAVLGGELRAKAELEASGKIVDARRALTRGLLAAQEIEYQTEKVALQRRASLIAGTEVGDKQKAALEENAASQQRLDIDNTAKRKALAASQAEALTDLNTKTAKSEIDIKKDTNTKLIHEQEARVQGEKAGSEERLHEAQVLFELYKKLYREDSAEYAGAKVRMAEEDRKFNENRKRIQAEQIEQDRDNIKSQLDIQKINIDTQRDLGLITARARLEAVRRAITEEHEAEVQSLEQKKQIWQQGTIEYERIQKQLVDEDLSYKKKMAQSDSDILKQRLAWYLNFNNQIRDGFANSIEAMIRGQKSLLQGTLETLGSIVVGFARNTALMLAEWVLKHTLMKLASKVLHAEDLLEHLLGISKKKVADTAEQATSVAQTTAANALIMGSDKAVTIAHIAGANARMIADTAASGIQLAQTIGVNTASVISEAGLAGAAGFASAMLALPFPENIVVAPITAAFASSSTLAFLPMAAAAKGAILTSDQPIFAHDREMILPAHISTGLQNVIAKGGLDLNANVGVGGTPSGGGNSPINIHYHGGDIQALDAAGVSAILMRNKKDVTKIIKKALHSGQLNVRGMI